MEHKSQITERKNADRKVLYRSPFIPAEWIAAHGMSPARFIPSSNSVQGPINDSEGICPFMRSFINESTQENSAAVILTTMCDQMRHAHELTNRNRSDNVFLFNLPSTWQSDAAVQLYISELKRLGHFLVEAGGSKPSDSELIDIMIKYDDSRKTERRRQVPASDGIPIAILGGAVSLADRMILKHLTDIGCHIVIDGTESGERSLPAPFDIDKLKHDVMTELASSYLQTIPDAFKRPNNQLFEWLRNAAEERQPRGIIYLRQVWCDIWHAESQRVRDCLKLPMLDLDINSEPPTPRTITRIEAFMEALR